MTGKETYRLLMSAVDIRVLPTAASRLHLGQASESQRDLRGKHKPVELKAGPT